MKAEIISVGTELLLGDITNTNSQYIAQQLMLLGIDTYRQVTVGDNPARLLSEIEYALKHVDIIISTGGLGPTNDDLTKDTAIQAFGQQAVLHEPSFKKLENYFRNRKELLDINRKQAMFPENALVIENKNGTAPGCVLIREDNKRMILLPGPPREMKPMFSQFVYPYLKKDSDAVMISRTLKITGMGEGDMANQVLDILEGYSNPTIAPYANEEGLILRITAKYDSEGTAREKIREVEEKLRQRLGKHVYGVDEETREGEVVKILTQKDLTVAIAESITGGMVASTIINEPGASRVLKESYIVYSDEAKHKILGVKESTLKEKTSVSEECLEEMLRGLERITGADICFATTGYAGPEGEEVGLVYAGTLSKGQLTRSKKHYGGGRHNIRKRVTLNGLDMIRDAAECFT